MISLVVFFVFLGLVLFLPSRSVNWVNGWCFLVIFFALTAVAIIHLRRVNPEIFVARGTIHKGTKSWDLALMAVLVPSFLAIFPIASLDATRWHISHVPLWLILLGYALVIVGYWICTLALAVNKFAEPGVRIQRDRGQFVVDTGPYAIVRHPLYSGAFLLCGGMPLALGSYLAFIPTGIGVIVLLVRTVLEDRTLQRELPGYAEYAARVRCRLIPGVW